MFIFRTFYLLFLLNKEMKKHNYDGTIPQYAKVVAYNADAFCFRKPYKAEIDGMVILLAEWKCLSYTKDEDRIKSITLTPKGMHYISLVFLQLIRFVVIPAVVAFITTIITYGVSTLI